VAAVRQATSQKAREVVHPQLFRSTFKDRPALHFPRDVAHPPGTTDVYNTAGQGVRFENGTGKFIAFLEASKATR
jgi:hypothetical protein